MWFIFPTILLSLGLLGGYLTFRLYKKGGSIQLKKVLAIVMLILLGGGMFLQKAGIVHNEQLETLLLAFDSDAREEEERLRNEVEEKKAQERLEEQKKISRDAKEMKDKLNKK